jgi:dTDP-4-dehydrorhamnose 3,5-epimerase
MKVNRAINDEIFLFEHNFFKDKRGVFSEIYLKNILKHNLSSNFNIVQENIVKSKKNVLRGMHFQIQPYEQSKLITVIDGKILDVIIDIRKDSTTFSNSYSFELTDQNSLFIPKGFAHGYLTLTKSSTIIYKVDNVYDKNSERGFNPLDKKIKINWGVSKKKVIINKRDEDYPDFNELKL